MEAKEHSIDPQIQPASEGLPSSLDRRPAYIVGIGASAGGLEALERLFEQMPVNTGMAFVVVQHLSPDFKSLTDELLARRTKIPIHQAKDGMEMERDAIYLLPPKKDIAVQGGKLLLTDKDPQLLPLPIDHFFRSLAQDAAHRAIAIILSGTGSDGSRGIRDIHEAGGLVIAQLPESAKFDGMPKSAVQTGTVHFTLAPEEIPDALMQYIEDPSVRLDGIPRLAEPVPGTAMEAIFRLLRNAYDIDFSHYKPDTVARRTERRLLLNQALDLNDYVQRLADDPDELNKLYKDLLIGVTRFFRDKEAFERLEAEVLPGLIRKLPPEEELRVWVAGCATGEEAYSLAILIHEQLEAQGRPTSAKILATDVHRASLDFASAGVYSAESLQDVSPARLERFFVRRGSEYHIAPDLRRTVVFARHNALKDAPFTKLDLITCRNLLIYFRPVAQKKVLSLFHFGLKPSGILFLGPSESPGELNDEFEVLDPRWKIYRKRRDIRLPTDVRLSVSSAAGQSSPAVLPLPGVSGSFDPQLLGSYDTLLDEFMPPSLLVNERREVVHCFGGASQHLRPRDGRFSADVLDMVDSELRVALSGALQRVFKEMAPVAYKGLRLSGNGGSVQINLTVKPITNRRSGVHHALICLEEAGTASPPTRPAEEINLDQASKEQVLSLETELRYTRENLQATIEELETSNEELQATNEELVAANEELQSTNEELHSVNEELYTVNAEYQKKIAELTELTADMDSLLHSTRIHTLFLDRQLRIRKFTPLIGEVFNLLPQDIGRRIDSFTHSIDHPNLLEDLRAVLDSGQGREHQVRGRRGAWYLLRILPYRSGEKIDGIVITLVEIDHLKRAEQEAKEAVEHRDRFLAMLSHELRNPLAAILNSVKLVQHFGVAEDGKPWLQVIERRSRHMGRMLDDLLDVARVTHNKVELQKQRLDLVQCAAEAVEEVRPWFEERHVQLHFDRPQTPLLIEADAARLQQIQVNLLFNAAKYTPANGSVWYALEQDGDEAILRIRDTGCGIEPEMLEKIFDIFVQADQSLHHSSGGLGVGLTLVRSLVAMHGGQIRAFSEGPGQGSEFVVRLPLARKTNEAGERERRQSPRFRRASLQVLLVEDDQDIRNSLQQILEFDGHHIHLAPDGPAALKALEHELPDVALVDIGLPGMDGFHLARAIRQRWNSRQLPLVALTGYGRASDRDAARDAGFDEHLTKPLKLDQLNEVFDRLGLHPAVQPSLDGQIAAGTAAGQKNLLGS